MKKRTLLLLATLLMGLLSFAQTTIHVPDDEPTIQDGIEAADDGDTVLVAQGTYVENIDFDGKEIWVASHWLVEQDSAHILNTVIDGSEPASSAFGSVVLFTSGEDTTSVLCGFTITGGTGSYYPDDEAFGGGGIRVESSSATIIHNRIIDNHVQNYGSWGWGGGITADNCNGDNKVIIRDNFIAYNGVDSPAPAEFITNGGGVEIYFSNYIIERNVVRGNSNEGCSWGSGIHFASSLGIVRNNVIDFNNAILTLGGDLVGGGSGIFVYDADPGTIISGNIITNNTVTGEGNFYGGGIVFANNFYSGITIEGNLIANNSAKRGGGMDLFLSDPACYIANNIISGNYAELSGGGIQIRDPSDKAFLSGNARGSFSLSNNQSYTKSESLPVLVNNTITGNSCSEYGGGIHNRATETDVVMFNNIIHGNTGAFGNDLAIDASSVITHLYNNNIDTESIDGTWEGGNNIFVDPHFTDNNYHLDNCLSECINKGTDEVGVGENYYLCPEKDMDGDERPYLNTDPDIGADETPCEVISGFLEKRLPVNELSIVPNPLNTSSIVTFELASPDNVELLLHDQLGRNIMTLLNKHCGAGTHSLRLDGTDLKSGIYFCTLRTNTGSSTRKVIKRD